MYLTREKIAQYENDGLLLIPNLFSSTELTAMTSELDTLMNAETPDIVYEADKKTVRALHGCHLRSNLYNHLIIQRRLVMPTLQLLSTNDVYLHQFKINIKSPFNGEVWPWHQDFTYWNMEDGIPSANNLTAIVFLDDVNEFNAPTCFIPGSHKEGNLNDLAPDMDKKVTVNWKDNFTARPKYTLDNLMVTSLINKYGIMSGKGPAGSVLFFDSNVVHASGQNISSYQRRLIFIAYNSIENLPKKADSEKRPEFLASQKYKELRSLLQDDLIHNNSM